MFRILTALFLVFAGVAQAQSLVTSARAAYVYDMTTGTVLLAKEADTPLPPASMSKLMTLYMAFEAIADGRLSPTDRLPVSAHAQSYGGSTMFLNTQDRVSVEDLLRGIIVLSGNDASVVIAEALSTDGTEAGFARMMTARAQELGMVNSSFVNANGWPALGQRMSVRDLGLLAQHIIEDYPTFYPLFSEQSFEFDGRAPANTRNRNPLLGLGIGADGLKTGHTEEAGYGLVGSATQGNRRIVFVISGLDSAQARAAEAEKIVHWAFRQFVERQVITGGTQVAAAPVWMGAADQVGLMVEEDLSLLLPVAQSGDVAAEAVFAAPIEAPVEQGAPLGELVITRSGMDELRLPLVATQSVAAGGFSSRLRTALGVVIKRIAPGAELPATLGGAAG